jgi:hypothetical protein
MDRWISARTSLGVPFERASEVLLADGGSLLPPGPPSDGDRDGAIVPLSVDVRGRAIVRRDIAVTLGEPRSAEGETWLPIDWEPTSHSHLLPSFHGVVELVQGPERAELAITGTYHVPLGVVGRFGDGIVGRRIAHDSLRLFLEDMVEQLDDRAGSDTTPRDGRSRREHTIAVSERDAPRPIR